MSAKPGSDYGVDDHRLGHKDELAVARNYRTLEKDIENMTAHFRALAVCWNKRAAELGMPITINVDKVVRRLEDYSLGKFERFFNRREDDGVLHEAQIITIVNMIHACLLEPGKCGLVLGALQSGKTMTAIASQFLGPVNYLVTGKKVRLIYLITSHKSHEDQTLSELKLFLDWYGEMEFCFAGKLITLASYQDMLSDFTAHPMYIEYPAFAKNSTTQVYRDNVLGGNPCGVGDTLTDPETFLQRRVQGRTPARIAKLCKQIDAEGAEPVLIIDESQFGASDSSVADDEGRYRKSVMRQIIEGVSAQITGLRVRFIAFSATPFELFDITTKEFPNLWLTKMMLDSSYVGFNDFGGEAICDGVEINAPGILNFSDFGAEANIPLMETDQFSAAVWALPKKSINPERSFSRFQNSSGFTGTLDEYVGQFEAALKAAIMHCVRSSDTPIGVCVRLCNSNSLTTQMIEALDLDPTVVQVLRYYTQYDGAQVISAGSVKRFLKAHRRPEVPFVMFVTNKARMGDAFPKEVKFFMECPLIPSTMNAILQGLVGRACGYGKDTTVILSEQTAGILSQWCARKGGHVFRGSRHVVALELKRGRPSMMIKIPLDMDDPVVRAVKQRINDEVVVPLLKQGTKTLQRKLTGKGKGFGPILRIAQETGLFEHLENPEVRARLFPHLHGKFRIIREGEKLVIDKESPEVVAEYVTEAPGVVRSPGVVRFSFRDSLRVHQSVRGRRTDLARRDKALDPQINVEKFDRKTGETIFEARDPATEKVLSEKGCRPTGDWRAHQINFPLHFAVQEIEEAVAQYPRQGGVFGDNGKYMTNEQSALRDEVEHSIALAKEKRRQKAAAR